MVDSTMIPASASPQMTRLLRKWWPKFVSRQASGYALNLKSSGMNGPLNTVLRSRSDVSTIHTNG